METDQLEDRDDCPDIEKDIDPCIVKGDSKQS